MDSEKFIPVYFSQKYRLSHSDDLNFNNSESVDKLPMLWRSKLQK